MSVEAVYNHDVAFLADAVVRYTYEVQKSVSSGQSGINEFDVARIKSYLDAIDTAHDHILSVPQLDLPETHPREWPVEQMYDHLDVESESANHVTRLLILSWEELVNSASARQASGINPHDSGRLRANVEKIRQFVVSYVETQTPLDLPESMPREDSSGPGRGGINP